VTPAESGDPTGVAPGESSENSAGRPEDPLVRIWPLFGLRITTPRLVLTPVRDEHLPELVDAALAGIHDPAVMPFSMPWTDAPPEVLRTEAARHQWRMRAAVTPDDWSVSFAVLHEQRVIGVQDLAARRFGVRRQVESGSWLTRSAQGHGLGAEMRAGVLHLAFDRLGATTAVSAAAVWNEASLGVSRRLGYRPNGTAVVEARRGETDSEQKLLLTAEDFVRPSWEPEFSGVEAAKAFLLL
jgi:RimJ/RimL family protein N-acetyltransferase